MNRGEPCPGPRHFRGEGESKRKLAGEWRKGGGDTGDCVPRAANRFRPCFGAAAVFLNSGVGQRACQRHTTGAQTNAPRAAIQPTRPTLSRPQAEQVVDCIRPAEVCSWVVPATAKIPLFPAAQTAVPRRRQSPTAARAGNGRRAAPSPGSDPSRPAATLPVHRADCTAKCHRDGLQPRSSPSPRSPH